MPCNDITDTLKIKLDHNGRIVQYSLRKKTCGGEVGRRALIGKWLRGRTAESLLEISPDEVLAGNPTGSEIREYLVIKHLLAVQSALAVLLGQKPGGTQDYCSVESIDCGPEGIVMTAQIRTAALSNEIEACRNCCSSAKTP